MRKTIKGLNSELERVKYCLHECEEVLDNTRSNLDSLRATLKQNTRIHYAIARGLFVERLELESRIQRINLRIEALGYKVIGGEIEDASTML